MGKGLSCKYVYGLVLFLLYGEYDRVHGLLLKEGPLVLCGRKAFLKEPGSFRAGANEMELLLIDGGFPLAMLQGACPIQIGPRARLILQRRIALEPDGGTLNSAMPNRTILR